jgi:hypothetical protein
MKQMALNQEEFKGKKLNQEIKLHLNIFLMTELQL